MTKTKFCTARKKKYKKLFKKTKGYFGTRKNCFRVAQAASNRALQFSFIGRKLKTREERRKFIQSINAAARQHGEKYSTLMKKLADANIEINRKALYDIIQQEPETFRELCLRAKQNASLKTKQNAC